MAGFAIFLMLTCAWALPINAVTNGCQPFEGPEDPDVDIMFPHESDCSKFYICSHGVPVELQCPVDLYFNPDFNYCDYPYNVNCTNVPEGNLTRLLAVQSNNVNQTKDRECPLEDPEIDVLYPHESHCNEFYQCSNGEKVLQRCPSDLYYNPQRNYCDWPENVNCTNGNVTQLRSRSVMFTGRANSNGKFCPLENPAEDILYPHEYNCSLFYKCFNGELVAHTCPPDLYYNPDKRYCDWPANVNCSTEQHNVTNNTGDCPLENPAQDILYPHESKCNVFYKCSNGQKVPIECLPGLYFNPKKNSCDWPENVNCVNHTNVN